MSGLKIFRIVIWGMVALLAAWLFILGNRIAPPEGQSINVMEPSTPAIGKPFELVSHTGRVVNNYTLRGKPYLVFFGFTHCPDICPTTLFELTDLMKELGPVADEFNVAFISVDPERDTKDLLSGYMTSFDPRIIALRGDLDQTETAVKAFAAYFRKVPTEGGNYTMDHTAGVYLMDAKGGFKGTLDMHESREIRLQKIRNLLATSS
jgi:protein SCO1/2